MYSSNMSASSRRWFRCAPSSVLRGRQVLRSPQETEPDQVNASMNILVVLAKHVMDLRNASTFGPSFELLARGENIVRAIPTAPVNDLAKATPNLYRALSAAFYNQAATLSALQTSMVNMRKAYGKEVMVVETDWPISCPQPKYAFPSDAKSIPFSAEGQTTWMKEVAKRIVAAGGTGIFYWEPAWIDNAGLGSSCPNNLMVDDSGKARSSLAVFADI